MATPQAIRPPATGNYFNFEIDVTTLRGSKMVVRKLVSAAVSSICYLRGVFGEEDYKDRGICDNNMKILDSNDKTKDLIGLTKAAVEAIFQGYVKELIIAFSSGTDVTQAYETHHISFKYNAEAVASQHDGNNNSEESQSQQSVSSRFAERENLSKEDLERKLLSEIRKFVLQICTTNQKLDPLPCDKDQRLSMVIHYNERAPEDYQARGYQDWEGDFDRLDDRQIEKDSPERAVTTKHHTVDYSIRSELKRKTPDSQSEPNSTGNVVKKLKKNIAPPISTN